MEKLNGVGVAFCGGGFKSYAQVAALEDMEKNDVQIAACAGTSAGSLIATLTAAGKTPAEIYDILVKADDRVVESGLLNNMRYKIFGLMKQVGMIPYESMLENAHMTLDDAGISGWEDIKMPLAIPAVDLMTGELTVFTNAPEVFRDNQGRWKCLSGDLDLAHCLVASSAYPLAISPCKYLDHYFIDGGCRMNLPTPLFNRDKVDAVIGIAMQRPMKPLNPDELGMFSVMSRTVSCGSAQLDSIYAQVADLFVNIPIAGADAFDCGLSRTLIQEARVLLASDPVDWSSVKPTDDQPTSTGLLQRVCTWFNLN